LEGKNSKHFNRKNRIMIDNLKIQNYQSWEDAELEFHPGVNAILGQSDKGKSALFRAINWVAFNRPLGTEFCSDWGGDTVVEVGVDGNLAVRRVRSVTKNYYQIIKAGQEGDPLKALASGVPEEISKILNLSPINLQYQMDAPFLLSDTPGEVGRRLNEVAGLESIDKASKNINSWLRVENSRLKTRQKDLEEERDDLDSLSWLVEAEEELTQLEKLGSKLERRRTRKYQLENLLGELVGNQERLLTFKDLPDKANRLKALILNDQALDHLKEDYTNLSELVTDIKQNREALVIFQENIKASPKVEELLLLTEELEELENQRGELTELCISIKGLKQRAKKVRLGWEEAEENMSTVWGEKEVKNKPDAILSSDWHLRLDTPLCRTDDYLEAQMRKIKFIKSLSDDHGGIPVIMAGDLFNKWWIGPAKESKEFIADLIKELPWIIMVPGQHDLPYHNLELLPKSGLAILEAAGIVDILINQLSILGQQPTHRLPGKIPIDITGFPYGVKYCDLKTRAKGIRTICVMHHLVMADKEKAWPGAEEERASKLLKKLKGYDVILTGDNPKQFVLEKDKRLLVNPGSMMRMKSDQEDHIPAVYLWWAESNTIEARPLPMEEGVISQEHIETEEKREERISAFVTRLSDDVEVGLSFRENLEVHMKKNKTKKSPKELVWRALDT
jgi:hypothetical protein